MDIVEIFSWIHQFTAYFATTKKSSNSKVLLAAMYLSGDAINWYQSWQEAQLKAHDEHSSSSFADVPLSYSWDDFIEKLKERFMPPQYIDRLKEDWRALKQNDTPVMSFSNKILQLGVQLRKSDEDRLESFLFGLDEYIKYDVRVMRPRDFNDVVLITLEQEMKHNKGKPKVVNKDSSSTTQTTQSQPNGKNNGKGNSSTSSFPSSPSPNTQKNQGNSNQNNKDKAKAPAAAPLTPDEKAAKGIIGGWLNDDERTSYAKEGR